MTDHRIVPRVESGLPAEVYNNDGVTVRPMLPRPVERIAIHYTGSPTIYGTPTLAKAQEWLRKIEANAIAGRKSNEYGYMVTSTDDGTVLEYAGLHWGAHSVGENDDTLAILVLCGGVVYRDGRYVTSTEVPSDALVDKVRWLVAVLQALGAVALDVEITLHRLLPDAATVCPGPAVESKVPAMRVPWVPPAPPPPIEPLGCPGVQATSATRSWYDLARAELGCTDPKAWSPDIKELGEEIATRNEGHALHNGDWYYLPEA